MQEQHNPSGGTPPADDGTTQQEARAASPAEDTGTGAAGPQELPQLSKEEELERMAGELADARAKAQENYDAYLRAVAEMENIRRRAQEDVAKAHKYGLEGFAESLLPVVDSLTAALADQSGDTAKMREGVELTLKQLTGAFEKHRLTEINPVGEKFDPHRHQAISAQPGQGVPPNHVIAVLQKGYAIADRVLRPALVIVAQGNP